MGKTNDVIRLDKVSKIYGMGEEKVVALDNIDLVICRNEYISIMGSSGSGKTTLLDIVTTMMKPTSGEVFIEGVNTTKMTNSELAAYRGKKIGFVFQTFNLLPKLTAIENVMTPLWINGVESSKRERIAKDLLESVDLGSRLNHRPNQLSGGQKQRVAIARALAMDPPLIVADEPTGNLDSKSGQNVLEILDRLHQDEKKTILIVTHDKAIGEHAEEKVVLKDGKMITEKKYCLTKKK